MANYRRLAMADLKSLGITQSAFVRYGPISFVLFIVVVSVVAFWMFEGYHPWNKDIKGIDALTAIVGLGAFVVGFQQWRSARQETSLERYYDRLTLANDARKHLNKEGLGISGLRLYVFAELDNLEYVIVKYRLGCMAAEDALRGVNTFRSRLNCVDGFDQNLKSLGNIVENAGYRKETYEVLERLPHIRAT